MSRPDPAPRATPAKRARGLWRSLSFVLGGPVAAFGARNIVDGARTIEYLSSRIKANGASPARVRVDDAGFFDLQETAYEAKTDVLRLQIMMIRRRAQTAVATKTYLAGGCCFLGFWFFAGVIAPDGVSMTYALALVAVGVMFLVGAFYNALVNWQIRTQRLGSVKEFLTSSVTWWPS